MTQRGRAANVAKNIDLVKIVFSKAHFYRTYCEPYSGFIEDDEMWMTMHIDGGWSSFIDLDNGYMMTKSPVHTVSSS